MPFQIPNHDADSLKLFSATALTEMRNIAATEFNELKVTLTAAADAGDVADADVINRSQELHAFVAAVDAHLDAIEALQQQTLTAAASRQAEAQVEAAVVANSGDRVGVIRVLFDRL